MRGGGLGRHPLVPVAAVEHLVRPVPAVVEILDEGQRQVADVGAERRHDGRAVGLVPDRLAAGQRHRMRIAEPAHAAHHAEVVIERPVLLHQHHDVLDVLERAGRPVGRDRQRPSDAVRQHRRRDAAARELEEPTPIHVLHPHHQPDPRATPQRRSGLGISRARPTRAGRVYAALATVL